MIIMEGSVGLVETKYLELNEKIRLESGRFLSDITIAYETYGELNKDKSNAIYIFHALSGDSHVAGYHSKEDKKPGWWDFIIGPGKAIDTNRFFVICSNVIGGCKGSTGPCSINKKTKKPYSCNFPIITVKDMVYVQKRLVEKLGIKKLYAVIGGSMGGMQVLEFLSSYPNMTKLAIPIACSLKQSPQAIAFHEVGRQAIMRDPNWNKGNYYDKKLPAHGLTVARMLSHITYLSEEAMWEKFGRKLQDKKAIGYNFDIEFQVESYLNYQGKSFIKRFDANSYLYITRAMDYFDLTRCKGSTDEIFKDTKAKCIIISISSDWLYPTKDNIEILNALRANDIDASFIEVESNAGHDAFLIPGNKFEEIIGSFLLNGGKE